MGRRVWLPDRLAARIALAFLVTAGALVVFGLMLLGLLQERQRDLLEASALGPAMAHVVAEAEGALADGKDPSGALATLHYDDLHFALAAGPPEIRPSWHIERLDLARPVTIALYRAELMPRPILSGADLARILAEVAGEMAATLRPGELGVGLSDGRWLRFQSARFWRERTTPVVLGLGFLAAAAAALGAMSLLARALARPVEHLALQVAEAERPQGMAVARSAPSEIRAIAAAFDRERAAVRDLVEERTRMLAAISHDLRTPATRLRLRAEFIEDDTLRDKFLADLDEMSRMIVSALDFLRDDAAREEEQVVAFTALLQSLCDTYAELGSPVRFVEAPPLRFETVGTVFGGTRGAVAFEQTRSLRLRCRPNSLTRAFSNLIDNALKYGERAEVMVHATADEILVEVLDDGPGIPEEERGNVLKPFYRLEVSRNRATGGSGLGLSIVSSIVEAHGGQLELLNRMRGGLRVRVTLPRRI